MTTFEKILNTAERDGYIQGMEASAGYIMSAAKETANEFDKLPNEEQKVMRDVLYKKFLSKINKLKSENKSKDYSWDQKKGLVMINKPPTTATNKPKSIKEYIKDIVREMLDEESAYGDGGS